MDEFRKSSASESDAGFEINVFELICKIWEKRWIVAVCMIACFLVMFVKVTYLTEDTYSAGAILYVANKSDEVIAQKGVQASDIEAAKKQASTYIEILKTRDFLEECANDTDGKYTWREVAKGLSVTEVSETELLQIVVTKNTADDAYAIASSILKHAPERLRSVYESGDVKVVQKVCRPEAPNPRNTLTMLALGTFIGAALGVLIVIVMRLLDRTLHKSDEVSKRYGITVLGDILNINSTASRKRGKQSQPQLAILNQQSTFDTIETYKTIRTNIMFSVPRSDEGKTGVVTSSAPGEGKTTTTINLAITIAQTGAKVLLIDADMRKARVHRYLELERGEGLSNVLCGFCNSEKAIHHGVHEPTLDVLTAGEIPPNPAELLDSDEFGKLLSRLSGAYDYVLIDTPPMTVVTDAAIIIPHAAGVVLVARESVTNMDMLDETVDILRRISAKILGVVVLDSPENRKKYGYYHNGKYGYRYGDEEDEEISKEALASGATPEQTANRKVRGEKRLLK